MKGSSKIYLYGVLICLGIIGLFWYFFFRNQEFAYQAEFKKLKEITVKINEARLKERELDTLRREIEVLNMKLEYAREKLPTEEEIDKLLREIHDIGLQARIKFVHFLPANKQKEGEYFKKPIDIKVVGPYHQIGIFLNKIGGLPRIVNVQSMSLKRVNISGNRGVEEASIKAFTYIYPETKSEKKPEKKEPPKEDGHQ